MPRRPTVARRWLTAATWPVGVSLTSWDYMWRTTVLHRRECLEPSDEGHRPPPLPEDIDADAITVDDGWGPLFHRRYKTSIRDTPLAPEALLAALTKNLNRAAPIKFARFQRVLGDRDELSLGDEYVVRMPGPWDGPVRVVSRDESSFRLATLVGHLEAGQIEFRASRSELLQFEIESWARSSGRFSNLLYHHVRMAKEIQLHMWISFLEGVVSISGGRMTGGIDVDTRRIEAGYKQ